MYINAHTYYSLRYGTLSPKQLVQAAAALGIRTLALTDINNSSCSFEFVRYCEAAGIKPVLGIEFRNENRLLYIALAKNKKGFYSLNKLLSECSLNNKPIPEVLPAMEEVWVIYPRLIKPIESFKAHEFLGVRPEYVRRIFSAGMKKYMHKLVAWNPITFLDEEGYTMHKLLRAVDNNTLITKLSAKDCAKSTERIYSPKTFTKFYEIYPCLIENTNRLLAHCTIHFEEGLMVNRQSFTGNKTDDLKLLTKLSLNGCEKRYGYKHKQALARVHKELKVIADLQFLPYFLITWDIVRYAQSMGYHYVGRGSGANSIVAYCLYITDVDPLELDLYFERFINPHRSSPPDFDIDFSWDERDDVTDYIFKRYGKEYTALLATYNTFKYRSIVRELGKVFGLPKPAIDQIAKAPLETEKHHELAQTIFKYGKLIEGLPNYLSIHAGGVLITEKPIYEYTALQMMPKGFPITHFDMYGAEDRGFHKYDVLSQRGLGHIKDAVALIKQNKGRAVDIFDLEKIKEDERVRSQLKSGHCIGCFYIESPAMRGLLSKLRCDNYIQLVAASSIIRPGVSKSGMMRAYIYRFHNPYAFEYLHDVFQEHLGETFGVMVYQEDVMKVVHHFAGLDLDESDVLRRMMSGKKKESDTFHRLQKKYFKNCKDRGHDLELTKEVWRQIESFAGYSFCKAHSASFAVESFQSLYLKAYFPLEFMVAVINNFGGFYSTEYYVHEARMWGANIHPPCINKSLLLTTIYDCDIYLGYIHVQGLEKKLVRQIIAQRNAEGAFRNLEDFTHRVSISGSQLELLIRVGAFRFTGLSKYELMWEKNAVFNPKEKFCGSPVLFQESLPRLDLPDLKDGIFDQSFDEMELLGFPLCAPFDLIEKKSVGTILAKQMKSKKGQWVKMLGYYVVKKTVTTSNGRRMYFGTWLDEEGHYFDSTHFPPSLEKAPFRGKGVYLIYGKIVEDFGFPSIEVKKMERLPFVKDHREAD